MLFQIYLRHLPLCHLEKMSQVRIKGYQRCPVSAVSAVRLLTEACFHELNSFHVSAEHFRLIEIEFGKQPKQRVLGAQRSQRSKAYAALIKIRSIYMYIKKYIHI
jgi:hypothetical protein